MLTPWKESNLPRQQPSNQPRKHIKKQSYYLANKSPSSQAYGFSSGRVWM